MTKSGTSKKSVSQNSKPLLSFNGTHKNKMTSYRSRRQLGTNLWLCESIFTQFRRLPPLCTVKQTKNSNSLLPAHPPIS